MELRQLTYFEAVVRCGGFTRAAERLHVAQSAVSAQVRALETELGVVLLERTTRRVALTHAGEVFLTRVQRILGELDGARSDLSELTAVLRGRVTLGATAVVGTVDLPRALAGFRTRYPGVTLTLRSALIAPLLAHLDAGEVDLVLGPVHDDLPTRYSVVPMSEEQLVVVTAPGGRPAGRRTLTLADLRDEPFVCLPDRSGLRTLLDAAASAAGFRPRIDLETHSAASIREMVSAGLGVALLARSAAECPGPPIAVHRVASLPPHPPIGLIHHRDHRLPPAAEACRRHLAGHSTVPHPAAPAG